MTTSVPQESGIDSTRAFLKEGYRFISRRCDRLDSDIFETRLTLRKVWCVRGEEAARMFYEPGHFTRKGAIPPTTVMLLQDRGSVQSLDGDAHKHRKAMFMSLMSPQGIEHLTQLFTEEWKNALKRWQKEGTVQLHAEAQEVLCRAVCRWSGLPLSEEDAKKRTREFAAMIDGAGTVGPRNWKGLLLRYRTELWARRLIDDVREGKRTATPGTALQTIADHRDESGEPLSSKIAGVELINVLRPTVAISRFITFAALALHEHPQARVGVRELEENALENFSQEVRRYYPFFPVVGGRASKAFEWKGVHFAEKQWVLLDLYGTNHDARIWKDPEAFRPERFQGWDGNKFTLIPQGAGDVNVTHRCPGERITLELMKETVRLLISQMRYEVPDQDLSIRFDRFPTLPASGFKVRPLAVAS